MKALKDRFHRQVSWASGSFHMWRNFQRLTYLFTTRYFSRSFLFLVLIALTNKVQRLTSFVNLLCQLPLRLVNSLTSVRQLQTGVGTRQQKNKEIAKPTKNRFKICISCLRQFWSVFVVELKSNSQYTITSLIRNLNRWSPVPYRALTLTTSSRFRTPLSSGSCLRFTLSLRSVSCALWYLS